MFLLFPYTFETDSKKKNQLKVKTKAIFSNQVISENSKKQAYPC